MEYDQQKMHEVAESFTRQFAEVKFDFFLAFNEFDILAKGIWASMMEERWNVFLLDDFIYFARSWTNFCIYKIYFNITEKGVLLTKFHANRDSGQYEETDPNRDLILLRNLIGQYTGRVDIVTLYYSNMPGMKISMELYFNDKGKLYFDGYDIGKSVETALGDSDYEYTYTIEPEEILKFYSLLEIRPGDKTELLLTLKSKFSGNYAYKELGKFMDNNKIRYSSFCWS